MVVVVVLPSLQLLAHVGHRDELVDARELVAQPSVERLDQPVVGGLARPRVVKLDAAAPGPVPKGLLEVNSVPLSTVIAPGSPRCLAASSTAWATHRPESQVCMAFGSAVADSQYLRVAVDSSANCPPLLAPPNEAKKGSHPPSLY